jgi:hypothetical protein
VEGAFSVSPDSRLTQTVATRIGAIINLITNPVLSSRRYTDITSADLPDKSIGACGWLASASFFTAAAFGVCLAAPLVALLFPFLTTIS